MTKKLGEVQRSERKQTGKNDNKKREREEKRESVRARCYVRLSAGSGSRGSRLMLFLLISLPLFLLPPLSLSLFPSLRPPFIFRLMHGSISISFKFLVSVHILSTADGTFCRYFTIHLYKDSYQ